MSFSFKVWSLFSKSSKTFLAKECVTFVTAEIQPAHPSSRPFSNFASEPEISKNRQSLIFRISCNLSLCIQ